MYIHVHVYMYVHVHVHVYMYVHVHVHAHVIIYFFTLKHSTVVCLLNITELPESERDREDTDTGSDVFESH